jgi:hypothetical protein
MTTSSINRRFVIARLSWLIEAPTTGPSAGITAFRENAGSSDLFSVFIHFVPTKSSAEVSCEAKIFALLEEMEKRLPPVGGRLVLTAGEKPVAVAEVISEGRELV